MDIIQGLVQAGSTAGKPVLRIVSNNNRTFDIINTITSNVAFTILNDGSVGAGSTIYTNLISNYTESGGGSGGTGSSSVSSQWTTVGVKIYYNSGNIGIGATDPIAPLHIYNATNARLLLDTAATGTATLEFRRGTGADMQNDYRFINDTSNILKLQYENSSQSFGNTIADLAWFSSNETIIHKNTTFNGRVGVGTAYHATLATRTLDVVGDANVSGTVSTSNLSILSSNAIITNTNTSNTALTIANTSLPIIITPATGYISTIITEGTPSIKYQTETFTFNQGNVIAYYKFNNSSSLGLDSNPSTTKYNLTPTIVGGTGGYNSNIAIEGGSFQATNDGDRLEGDFPLKSIYDNSTTGISVSCWFYKKSGTSYDNIYYTQVFTFSNPTDVNQGVNVSVSHYNNIHNMSLSFQYTSGETYCSRFGPIQTLDTWYHIVLIFTKSGTIKAYLNGTNLNLVTGTTDGTIRWYGSSAYPLPQCPNTTKLRIYNTVGSGAFSGNIDEFYVFNKELTQTEITNLYNKTYSLPNNTWNINFPTSTPVIINNGASQNVLGNYTISVSNNSSVIPAGGQSATPYPSTAITTVAIKYPPIISTATINLIRGTVADANHDWKLGNFNGDFKIISSVSSVDTDYIKITTAGAITNPTGTATWNTGSDRRIKENIERASYDKCYECVNKLELNCFNYVEGFNRVNRDKTQLGFIAQEVSAIFPKSISTQGYYSDTLSIPDLLSIDISQINYALYGAVKKLIEKNDEDQERMNSFNNRINTISELQSASSGI
jgi:hypothetical protein